MDLKSGTRRELLIGAGATGAALLLLTVHPATATTESMDAAIKTILGGAKAKEGKVQLDIPPLVENGNTVAMTVTVDSPMSATDYVKAIHIFNERNPQPYVASFFLGPRTGKADISARIRLSDSQNVTAIAHMSDGSFWSMTVSVIVTLAACLESTN
jgi:sulfur-oxidizing protein SoxY